MRWGTVGQGTSRWNGAGQGELRWMEWGWCIVHEELRRGGDQSTEVVRWRRRHWSVEGHDEGAFMLGITGSTDMGQG